MTSDSRYHVWHFHIFSRNLRGASKALVYVCVPREHGVRPDLSFGESGIEIFQHSRASRVTTASAIGRMVHDYNQRQPLSLIARSFDFLQLVDQKSPLGITSHSTSNDALMFAAVRE